jgi:DNA mismatch repair protein MutS2
MTSRFVPGQTVQTPLGSGVILELRNAGRALVQVHDRAVLFAIDDLRAIPASRAAVTRSNTRPRPPGSRRRHSAPANTSGETPGVRTIDLHGLTVEAALDTLSTALNDALLADAAELRVIHGRSGGRIRAAVHARLRELPFVRHYRLDPRNEGVTIVTL